MGNNTGEREREREDHRKSEDRNPITLQLPIIISAPLVPYFKD